jgi:hypothetical protein
MIAQKPHLKGEGANIIGQVLIWVGRNHHILVLFPKNLTKT